MPEERVIVIGCGIVGLAAAVELAEAGYKVEVRARELTRETTSFLVGALFHPFKVGPHERVRRWSFASLDVFREQARDPASGIALRRGTELHPSPEEEPWFAGEVPGFRRLEKKELPGGFGAGFEWEMPVIEMPRYLPWLEHRARDRDVGFVREAVAALQDLPAGIPVVNCSGLGAGPLVPDPKVRPVRGQLVRVTQCGVDRFLWAQHAATSVTYVVPRHDEVVLGGTLEPQRTDLEPDPQAETKILARARDLVPALRDAQVLGSVVGLRPMRPSVRLEAEERQGRLVVHDYGHGGAGVTLAWGCAREARELLQGGHR